MSLPGMPEDNKLYSRAEQLPARLWDDLAAADPALRASICGASCEGRFLRLKMLDAEYLIDPNARNIFLAAEPESPVSFSTGLPLLAYLLNSPGAPPAGRMISPLELPGGEFFFKGPHALPTRAIEKHFENDLGTLHQAALRLGGSPGDDAPAHYCFLALPLLPMALYYWPGDGEFAARAAFGLDSRSHLHFALDALWSLFNHFAATLCSPGS